MSLLIERMTAQEMQGMAAWQRAQTLNEICHEQVSLTASAVSARLRLAEARNSLLTAHGDAVIQAKRNLENAKAAVDALKLRAQMLNKIQSLFQSLIRNDPSGESAAA